MDPALSIAGSICFVNNTSVQILVLCSMVTWTGNIDQVIILLCCPGKKGRYTAWALELYCVIDAGDVTGICLAFDVLYVCVCTLYVSVCLCMSLYAMTVQGTSKSVLGTP